MGADECQTEAAPRKNASEMAFDDRFASERIQKETLNLMKFACNHLSIIVELMRSRSHRRWDLEWPPKELEAMKMIMSLKSPEAGVSTTCNSSI